MDKAPVVSVFMPVYNSRRYVAAAIESVLAQTFADFELILIDDGSTDDSLAILKQYEQRDPRIRLTSRPNKGIPATRNEGVRLARGEFIAMLDADDIALPQRLEKQVAFLRAHPEVVCCGSYFYYVDAAGRLLTLIRTPVEDEAIQKELLKGHCAIFQSTAMMRLSAVREVGAYDEDFPVAQDLDLWLRLGEKGKLANLTDPLVRYRLHDQSVSETARQKQQDKAKMACERAWSRRGITGTFEATELWRPGKDRGSRHAFALRYGWWAFNAAQRRTAMFYGAKAIAAQPLSPDGWKLLAAATIKRMPQTA